MPFYGGVYLPPARFAALSQQASEKDSRPREAYQKQSWDALRKSLNGLINKVNTGNIKNIVMELFSENLIRGRGLLARSLLKAQSSSILFTPVFASLVSIINSKLPIVGEIILKKLVLQFRRSYRRNDKSLCLASVTFLAHLVNQQVAHEILPLQLLTLLLERSTDDSVEIAIGFLRECGMSLSESSPKLMNILFERFRHLLVKGNMDVRVQWMIQVLFQTRRDKFKDFPSLKPELDLVEEDDRVTHYITLDDEIKLDEDGLLVFRYDATFEENEAKYAAIKEEILGDVELAEQLEESAEDETTEDKESSTTAQALDQLQIKDRTNTNLIHLRKTIYLTVMSSLEFEECCHKLLKLNIPEGQEIELCNMIVECCSQEKTYIKFYGLLSQRLCLLNPIWVHFFELCWTQIYTTIHRVETNRLRNMAKLFAYLLATDALPWSCLSVIHLNESETTSASRVFIKIVFMELTAELSIPTLQQKLSDPELQPFLTGLFPKDNLRNTRFAINFFTAIQLGPLTDELRAFVLDAPKAIESSAK